MLSKILNEFELFMGIKCDISICCIIFYQCVWLPSIRLQIPDYAEKMWELSEHSGVLLCPECMIRKLAMKKSKDKKLLSIGSIIQLTSS